MLAIRVTNLVFWNLGVYLKPLSNLLCRAAVEVSKRKSWDFKSHIDYTNPFMCVVGGAC